MSYPFYDDLEISVEPWKKLIIHEIIEYVFEDWVKQIAFSSRTSGGGIPTMQWANGVVFFTTYLSYSTLAIAGGTGWESSGEYVLEFLQGSETEEITFNFEK